MKSRSVNALLITTLCTSTAFAAETTKLESSPNLPVAASVGASVGTLPVQPTPPATSSAPETTAAPDNISIKPAWDYKSMTEWRRLLASDAIVSVAFSPDGKTIAGGGDGKVFLWNQQGDLLNTITTEAPTPLAPEPVKDPKDDLLGQKPVPKPIATPKNLVTLLIYSPDGKVLATSSDSTVKLWNAETGAWLRTLAGHVAPVTALVFTPDSRAIATGSVDKNIKVWGTAAGQLLGTLSQHVYPIRALAFSEDVKSLISVGVQGRGRKNGELKVWDVAGKGELLQENTLDGVSAGTVQLVAQGRILAAGSDGVFPSVKLWNPQDAVLLRATVPAHSTGNVVTSLVFSPDYAIVAGGGGKNKKSSQVWLWEVKTGKMLKEIKTSPQNALALSPDGRVLAVAGEDKAVQLWRVP